jgi:hypothetical protein
VKKSAQHQSGEYAITGNLAVTADGGFTLSLTGSPAGEPPVTEPPPDLPPDAVILEPSGGDDTQRLRNAVQAIPEGGTLALKGMFRVADTIKLEGGRNRTVCGYPDVRSGILVESPDMPGAYGSMLWMIDAVGSTMRDMEIDVQNHSTLPMEIVGGSDCTVSGLYIHDIRWEDVNDSTLAAIHSEHSTRLRIAGNRIERTGGRSDIDSGIRGIWMGKGQVELLVEDNEVSDTGHTCIAVEPASATVRRNKAYNSLTQGTLYKISLHPETPYAGKIDFYENHAENSRNGGLMLEGASYESVEIRNNTFRNCGAQGTSFGALYTSQYWTKNLRFHDNTIENCRSQGAMNCCDNCTIENNKITGESTLWLENDDKNITVRNSGNVHIGNNCSNIWVDGQQKA